ncbi:MAG TPA: prenyltransferase/squalene oxidase repeat-containing protein [Candidatus Saccharimonadales bacterium]|nr:prenyltransferase/squalene oxidase repeat-containing protein [Candidatus Saccharimonadales bacterium]
MQPLEDSGRLRAALEGVQEHLLAQRCAAGHWEGELSSSALSTATAVTALAVVQAHTGQTTFTGQIQRGLDWLAAHANTDGVWGDTILSLSNLSTTMLCWAAFGAVPGADAKFSETVLAAENWFTRTVGSKDPDRLGQAVIGRYGKDRTFSIPILTMCALAGRLGIGAEAWRRVIPLPFELAAFPHGMFAALRLPVVSYALPALIAIGQARHYHAPSRNPAVRFFRNLTREVTLSKLERIQPSNGGFLEATPLTSFVTMSLAGSGQAGNVVTTRGVDFLSKSQLADGSWPIDTNLATWVTTMAVNALGELESATAAPLRGWLLQQQYRALHPYTHASPGGWAWTDLPGGVPDADDTSGALLALRRLGNQDPAMRESALAGVRWLLGLQNRDGGIPTFCRGWGTLPFDQSSADITAHTIRAWLAWKDVLPRSELARTERALARALDFLCGTQREDGSWVPLWFGNQFAPGDENPTYGTARVLCALALKSLEEHAGIKGAVAKACAWLMSAQNEDGSWGGYPRGKSSVEETALAVEALCEVLFEMENLSDEKPLKEAVRHGAAWLLDKVESGDWTEPSPIGFYFAKLWYYEKLYPVIFTAGALRAVRKLNEKG